MIFLYFFIGLFASTVGAIAGLGGGVIIKPLLDLFGHYDLATIGILSASTVLSMATISLIKSRKKEIKIEKSTSIYIAFGSILGGISGKWLFNYVMSVIPFTKVIAIFQSTLLALLMVSIYLLIKNKHKMNRLSIQHKMAILLIGLFLGIISAFLGIGGGPLNVAILALLFSMTPKQASLNSIFIIFFAQSASLLFVTFTTGFQSYNLSMLLYMIIGGITGGWLGSNLTSKVSNQQVETIFNISILLIFLINVYNIIEAIF